MFALSASIRFAFEGGSGSEILCANTLSENESLNGTFDVVLTNPPFGSKAKLRIKKFLSLICWLAGGIKL